MDGGFGGALATAAHLVISGDPELTAIVLRSLRISAQAVVCAGLIGLPLGAVLAVARFRGSY